MLPMTLTRSAMPRNLLRMPPLRSIRMMEWKIWISVWLLLLMLLLLQQLRIFWNLMLISKLSKMYFPAIYSLLYVVSPAYQAGLSF